MSLAQLVEGWCKVHPTVLREVDSGAVSRDDPVRREEFDVKASCSLLGHGSFKAVYRYEGKG